MVNPSEGICELRVGGEGKERKGNQMSVGKLMGTGMRMRMLMLMLMGLRGC